MPETINREYRLFTSPAPSTSKPKPAEAKKEPNKLDGLAREYSSSIPAILMNLANSDFELKFVDNRISTDSGISLGYIEIREKNGIYDGIDEDPLDRISVRIEQHDNENVVVLYSLLGSMHYKAPDDTAKNNDAKKRNENLRKLICSIFDRFNADVLVTTDNLDANPPNSLRAAVERIKAFPVFTIFSRRFWASKTEDLYLSVFGRNLGKDEFGNITARPHKSIG
ncbi:MAG: hypothetical protein OXU45_04330 [Candidatus Melainabacteria bacterium]|nr:hypothetical protein [Candidatus Melainabacteria bacterium]